MSNITLGKLKKVDLRKVWKDEARNFTPWLAQEENIALLSETLEMSLEVLDVERAVGPYSADIVCQNLDQDDSEEPPLVVIENQLNKTDHSHLGQGHRIKILAKQEFFEEFGAPGGPFSLSLQTSA